jgi:hypothetical protein
MRLVENSDNLYCRPECEVVLKASSISKNTAVYLVCLNKNSRQRRGSTNYLLLYVSVELQSYSVVVQVYAKSDLVVSTQFVDRTVRDKFVICGLCHDTVSIIRLYSIEWQDDM